MKNILTILILCLAGLLVGVKAQAQVVIDIENVSHEPLPLMLIPLQIKEGDAAFSKTFNDEMKTYLDLSEHFRLIDPQALLKDVAQEGFLTTEIDFKQYQLLSAAILIKGWVKIKGERVLGELFAFDVAAQTPILHDPLAFNKADAARVTRDFVDRLLLKLTGERGIFDTRIAFISNRTSKKELYVMNFDGTNLQPLTKYENIVLSPCWTPDGETVTFVGYPRNPRKETPQLFMAEPGSDTFRAFRRLPSNVISPTWMPDGLDLIATLSHDGDAELYRINMKGGDPKRLTFRPGIDVSPTISPDGKWMAWSSDAGGTPQIYVQPLDGSATPKRISFEGKYNTSPDWSPHGGNIAYVSLTEENKNNLVVTRPDGTVSSQLTIREGNNESPSWSPDGRRLVFSSNRDGRYHIYTMTVDGKSMKQLTFGKFDDTMPAWSPRRRSNIR